MANIKERLDQCLCDQEWQSLFPKAGVRHLCNSNSDHNPIMLDTFLDTNILTRPFRFEAMWTREEEGRSVVEDAWQCRVDGSQGFKLVKKLSVTSQELKRSNKSSFGNSKEKINGLKAKIAEVQQFPPTRENLELEASLNLELDKWQDREDMRLRQLSRELWVKEGVRNSRFFHLSTIIRIEETASQKLSLMMVIG